MTKDNNKNIAQAQAVGKSLKTSPQKANLVLRTIRGKKAEDALSLLTFQEKEFPSKFQKSLGLLFLTLKTIINLISINSMLKKRQLVNRWF